MQKVKIRLPATLTDLGPGLQSVGLAVGLYAHVEISPRSDDQLIVETGGEGAGQYAIGLRHPVALGLMRIFQQVESAPPGIHIKVSGDIPLASGLGAEAAFMVAGIIAGNNLMGSRFSRAEMIDMAARFSGQADNAVTALLGGLTTSATLGDTLLYRSLPLVSFKVILAVPRVAEHTPPASPERLTTADMFDTLRRLPLMLEALRTGDLKLLAQVIDSPLMRAETRARIPGYAHVAEVARLGGALATTTSGGGPTMVVLAEKGHDRLAEVIENAFHNLNLPARVCVVPLDTQGVVLSMMQSS
ncbi:MAG: hypothetical protein MUE40_05415 [Anaerolineae bacterium]|nr:hypothetical protein [Anaerolineae bacterium]